MRVRAVCLDDDEVVDRLTILHALTFGSTAPMVKFDGGWWWIATEGAEDAGFIGIVPSDRYPNTAYYYRVGVLHKFRGRGLQKRMTWAMEKGARKLGFRRIITDTTDNCPSVNSLIACGYKAFDPEVPWSFENAVYWTKNL